MIKVPQNLESKLTGLHFSKTFLSGLSALICLGGGYFRKRLFSEDESNVNITQTNFMRFIFSIKLKKHFLLNCVVDRLTPLLLIQAMDLFFRGAQKQLFPDVLQIKCS